MMITVYKTQQSKLIITVVRITLIWN